MRVDDAGEVVGVFANVVGQRGQLESGDGVSNGDLDDGSRDHKLERIATHDVQELLVVRRHFGRRLVTMYRGATGSEISVGGVGYEGSFVSGGESLSLFEIAGGYVGGWSFFLAGRQKEWSRVFDWTARSA